MTEASSSVSEVTQATTESGAEEVKVEVELDTQGAHDSSAQQ